MRTNEKTMETSLKRRGYQAQPCRMQGLGRKSLRREVHVHAHVKSLILEPRKESRSDQAPRLCGWATRLRPGRCRALSGYP